MAPFMGMRGPSLAVAVGLVSGLCFFLFGYDQGDLAGILTIPAFREQFPQVDTIGNPDDLHTATIQGVTTGTWNIGCFVSAMITIFWGDLLGRRRTIMVGLIFLMIGEIVQCTSFSFGQFIAGRFIAGFGNGFNTATVPAWQAECTKAHRRGTLLMVSAGACIAAGLSFSYWMAFAFAWAEGSSVTWRAPIAVQLVFLLPTLGLITVCPESPRWLILKGREKAALETLSALGESHPEAHEVRMEFLQIKDAVIEMAKGDTGDVFSLGDYRHFHRVVLAYVLQVFQQMSGINLILQYLALIFVQQFEYTRWVAMLIAACAGTQFFLASFIAVVGIDRFWGRRSLIMFGASGMSLCMTILTIMKYLDSTPSLIAGTVFIFLFNTFFAIGLQAQPWLYQVEIIPLRIRGPAAALSTSANWLLNFVVVLIAPVAFHTITYRTYIIFAVTNAVFVPVVYYLYPETGFRSLEEVDVIFHAASLSSRPWLDVRKIAASEPLWYGKGGVETGDYESSEWHQKHVRFSDEIKDSDGGSHALKESVASEGPDSPRTGDEAVGTGVSDDEEKAGGPGVDSGAEAAVSPLACVELRRGYGEGGGGLGEAVAPSPPVSRSSWGRGSARSAGRA